MHSNNHLYPISNEQKSVRNALIGAVFLISEIIMIGEQRELFWPTLSLAQLCTLLVWYRLTRLLAFNISNIETHVDAVLHHYFELCTFTVSQTTSNKCVSSFAQIVLLVCQLKIWTDLWHRDGALLGQLLFGLLAGIRVTEVRVEILVQNLCRLLAEVAPFLLEKEESWVLIDPQCLWLKREQISANMVLFYAWSLILIYFSKNPVLKIKT